MSARVNWANPYADRAGIWYRGTLHTHAIGGGTCPQVELPRVLELYAQRGFDFLSVSDHMKVTVASHPELVLIPGMEWNDDNHEMHTGVFSTDPGVVALGLEYCRQDDMLPRLAEAGAIVILNHPDWKVDPHYSRRQLMNTQFYDGIEIYNACIEQDQGSAISTHKWDYLLSNEHRVLGFSGDDAHTEDGIGRAWMNVRAHKPTPGAIFDALRSGNFYCSSGVVISDIRKDGNVIVVETENAQEIWALAGGGARVAETNEKVMELDVSRISGRQYVRFTAYGHGASRAWTQPFFFE